MEFNNMEVATVEEVTVSAEMMAIGELTELQLALVGGGIGDPIIG
jgi:hypothetical protein